MTGPVRESTAAFVDLRRRELMVVAPLVALILALGFFPKPVLDVIDDGVDPVLTEVGVSDPQPIAPVAEGNDR
jgi:NADH-quinone oxidoreductase subunit M